MRHRANCDTYANRLSDCINHSRTHRNDVAHSNMHADTDAIPHAYINTNSDALMLCALSSHRDNRGSTWNKVESSFVSTNRSQFRLAITNKQLKEETPKC